MFMFIFRTNIVYILNRNRYLLPEKNPFRLIELWWWLELGYSSYTVGTQTAVRCGLGFDLTLYITARIHYEVTDESIKLINIIMSIYIKLNWMHCTLTTRVEPHHPALTTVHAFNGNENGLSMFCSLLNQSRRDERTHFTTGLVYHWKDRRRRRLTAQSQSIEK